MLVQILVGLPLEMVHGSGRVMIVYISGVLAGTTAGFYVSVQRERERERERVALGKLID